MYVCILNQDGEIILHRNRKARLEAFLNAIAPYREDVMVAVECLFTWYWLADLCCREGMAFGLGPALDCLHATTAGQQQLARLEKQHGNGKALTMLAPRVARAVSTCANGAGLRDVQVYPWTMVGSGGA
jgi:hypothetical protein